MSEDKRPVRTDSDDGRGALVWLRDTLRQGQLAWRLFWDKRVPLWIKVIPPAALVYFISPVDFIPEGLLPGIPGLPFLDDLAIVILGAKLFIDLSPADVVREHLRALGAKVDEWRVVGKEGEEEDQTSTTVEGEYTLGEGEE